MRITIILAFCILSATLKAQVNRLVACAITSEGLYFNKQKFHPRGENAYTVENISDSIPVSIAKKIKALGAIRYTEDQFLGLDVSEFTMVITPENGEPARMETKGGSLDDKMIFALSQIKPKDRISFEFIKFSTRDEPNNKGSLGVLTFIVY